ncbi:MAG TPA: DUF2950 domain-containing protein [Planctomycetota bacterium]
MITIRQSMNARALLIAVLGTLCSCAGTSGVSRPSATFAKPEDAIFALADLIGTRDTARIDALFGSGGLELLESGDEVADREDGQRVKQKIREKLVFEDQGPTTKIALLGSEGWPLPIPLILEDGTWSFDVEAGIEEIENRRVGRNELSTIETMHEYVEAQREYHAEGRDGQPPAYARKVISSEGKHDGLYWRAAENEPESPFGPLIAAAARDGYPTSGSRSEGEPVAYHGYYYRSLTAQGAHAPGGALNYLDGAGRMTRGFALLAWPAKYGSSGVMTFLVNARGIVYQKDLGDETEAAAAKIQAFDPDASWDPTGG